MKFGKKLESQQDIPVFRQQFVSYTNLKKLIKEINISERRTMSSAELLGSELWWFDSTQKTSINSIPADRVDFIRAVEDEIDKTQHVYTSMSTSIKHMLRDIYARLNSRFRLEKIEDDIDSISSDVLVLDRYIWHAKQLVLKITKKHDRATKFQVQSWMLVRLERSEWWNCKLDEYLIGVSDAYSAARLLAQNADGMFVESRKVGDGESFVRKNEKYFVKPEDVMLVKLLIARHVPLDIFGRKKKKADAPLKLEDLAGLTDASVCNSIYLDDDARTMYHERTGLEGVKGNIIRIRWYGSFANPCDECWMERKTRRIVNPDEDYCMDEAVKERFRINKRNIASYMSGKWAMAKKAQSMVAKKQIKEAQVGPMLETANNIQEEIVTKHLHSALRTVVRRSAFQAGSDQSLRFSLDHNLHIIDEVNSGDGWARNLEEPLRLSSVKTLPYAVLEVKTQKEAPEWVNQLKDSGYIIPSAHFSKFLYGTCKLAPSEVRFYPMWWERVVELEVQIPGSPPLIMCPLMTKTPSSVKFRSSLVDKMEQQADAYEAKMAAQLNENTQKNATLTKKESRKATEFSKYNNPVAGIEMAQFNPPTKVAFKEQPAAKAASPTSDDGATLINIKKPTTHQTNGGGLFNLGKKPADKKITAKQRTMEQRAAKTFFANERTMLSWLNASTFLALAGITLLSNNTQTGRDAGVALIAVTVIFALYSLYKYLTRLSGLQESKKAGLADKWGPPVLIACFAIVLIFLAIYYGRKATENLDSGSSSS